MTTMILMMMMMMTMMTIEIQNSSVGQLTRAIQSICTIPSYGVECGYYPELKSLPAL